MERFNGELRDREKVTRNLKKPDTPILSGMQIYHNYVRPHMGLDGKTPSEKAGIGKRWLEALRSLIALYFQVFRFTIITCDLTWP
jgi:hypothetical protein